MMSNLMCYQPVDRGLPHPFDRMDGCCGDGFRVVEPQGPIPVHVRVRQYGGSSLDVSRRRSKKPDCSQLPVGTFLDCYV